ncbi:hypothetical protein CsSME_00050465 [Camellia sinensis var. sinensis]
MQERVIKCVELINESSLASGFMKGPSSSVPSVPQSPIGVLHPACLSYKADGTTVGSCPSSSHSTPDSKRRKLNRPFSLCLLSFFLDLAKDKLKKSMVADIESGKSVESKVRISSGMLLNKAQAHAKLKARRGARLHFEHSEARRRTKGTGEAIAFL